MQYINSAISENRAIVLQEYYISCGFQRIEWEKIQPAKGGSNLVFYYGDVGYFNGIVRIGHFDGSLDAIVNQTGDFTATIELAN